MQKTVVRKLAKTFFYTLGFVFENVLNISHLTPPPNPYPGGGHTHCLTVNNLRTFLNN
jgi:hypothetical protein